MQLRGIDILEAIIFIDGLMSCRSCLFVIISTLQFGSLVSLDCFALSQGVVSLFALG